MVRTDGQDARNATPPAQIKAALELAGYYQTDIARQLGITPTTVGEVIRGKSRSRQVENRIAVILGKTPYEIWPHWYGKDGKPIRGRRRPVRLSDAISRIAAAGSAAVAKG